jgi:hypothetical protein
MSREDKILYPLNTPKDAKISQNNRCRLKHDE